MQLHKKRNLRINSPGVQLKPVGAMRLLISHFILLWKKKSDQLKHIRQDNLSHLPPEVSRDVPGSAWGHAFVSYSTWNVLGIFCDVVAMSQGLTRHSMMMPCGYLVRLDVVWGGFITDSTIRSICLMCAMTSIVQVRKWLCCWGLSRQTRFRCVWYLSKF